MNNAIWIEDRVSGYTFCSQCEAEAPYKVKLNVCEMLSNDCENIHDEDDYVDSLDEYVCVYEYNKSKYCPNCGLAMSNYSIL